MKRFLKKSKGFFKELKKSRAPSPQPVSSAISANIVAGASGTGAHVDQNIGVGGMICFGRIKEAIRADLVSAIGSDNESTSGVDLRESDLGQRPHTPGFSAQITGRDNDVPRACPPTQLMRPMLTIQVKVHEPEPEQEVSMNTPSEQPTQDVADLSSAAGAGPAGQDSREPDDQGTTAECSSQVAAEDVAGGSPVSEAAHTAVQSEGER